MLPTTEPTHESRAKELLDWAMLTLGILSLSIAVAGTILTKTAKVSAVTPEETNTRATS